MAEKSDLIFQLGVWVIERACRDKARWQRHPADRDAFQVRPALEGRRSTAAVAMRVDKKGPKRLYAVNCCAPIPMLACQTLVAIIAGATN